MNINETQDRIIADFEPLHDWLDKYEAIIAMGNSLAVIPEKYKTGMYALAGCQSQVWIRAKLIDGRLRLTGDSDSLIIRGILTLLLQVLNGRKPDTIVKTELYFLDAIGLRSQLSPSRANGLSAIINHIRRLAEGHIACRNTDGKR